jgi:hypothetical protein
MMQAVINFWRKGYFYILLAGILVFVFLVDPRIGMYDWGKEMAYFNVIKISLTQYNSLPIFWWNPQGYGSYPAISVSSFFLANPETFSFSPFIFLLFWMKPLLFMKILVCIFCAIGTIGILMLSRKLKWQDEQRRIFIALFLFSPIIIQHLAIGYLPWLNLYLFPWLIYYLIEEDLFNRVLGCASILALTLLQGGVHPFIWFVFFIGFYSAVRFFQKPGLRIILFLVALIVLTALLSMARVTTSAQTFADFQQKFFNGYSWNGFITWGLTPPVFTPTDMDDIEPYIESYNNGVPYWDGAIYWGAVLPLVLVLFFVLVDKKLLHKEESNDTRQVTLLSIAIASLLITVLSFSQLYQNLITGIAHWINIPSLQSMEKYPFRFAILGYFGFSVCISHYYFEILILIKKPIIAFLSFLTSQKERKKRISKNHYFQWIFLSLIIISTIYFMSYYFRDTFLSWLEPAIQSAYRGEGNTWLAGLMSQRLTIPITAYIQKAHTFYSGIQTMLLIIVLAGWGIYLLLRFSRPIATFLFPLFQFLQKRMSILIEMILVIPLLFASIMWMRVALATPISYSLSATLLPPQIEIQPASLSVSVSTTPSQLSILTEKSIPNQKIILSNINYSDRRFLQGENFEINWFNSNGFLGFSTGNDPLIVIKVKPASYLPALWITLVSWFLVIGAGSINYLMKKNKKSGS